LDKFLELPLPQRLLVVGVIMAIMGGASYYFLISKVSDDISAQARKYKGLMADYGKLKEYDSDEFKQQMEKQRTEAERRSAAYSKMLPREEELPDLITSIKTDADNAGLVLAKFEPVKKREDGEGYRAMSFRVDIAGTYAQFLTFLQSLAAPSKRLINVKNLGLDIAATATLEKTAGDVGLLRILNDREKERGLTPNEKYVKTILLFDEIAKRVFLKASFTAVAYVYTGAGVPAKAGPPPAPGAPAGGAK
jgi:Tfp pilus assembly protein PilO